MAADGYAWWRSRLRHLAQYFTAYRIDHVLGFFRIWEVPGDCVTGGSCELRWVSALAVLHGVSTSCWARSSVGMSSKAGVTDICL